MGTIIKLEQKSSSLTSKCITANRDIFVVEIFPYSMLCTKIKHPKLKYMRIIDVNVHGKGPFVQKLLNTKNDCAKYF